MPWPLYLCVDYSSAVSCPGRIRPGVGASHSSLAETNPDVGILSYTFKIIKIKLEFLSSVALATFHVLSSQMYLVVPMLTPTERGHLHCYGQFCWTSLVYQEYV